MTALYRERHLSGDHWAIIFDYLDIHTLLTLSRTARIFQEQLRPTGCATADEISEEPKFGFSPYLTNRILRAILAPYYLANPSFNKSDLEGILPPVIRKAIQGDLTHITFTVFKTIYNLIDSLHKKYLSLDHSDTDSEIPIPIWSLDKDTTHRVLQYKIGREERYIFDREANLKDEAVTLVSKTGTEHLKPIGGFYADGTYPYNVSNPATIPVPPPPPPQDVTTPDFYLPFDAALIFRYYARYLHTLSNTIYELHGTSSHILELWASAHNNSLERFYWDISQPATWDNRNDDYAGGWTTEESETILLIPCGKISEDDTCSNLFLDCTPEGRSSAFGALYSLPTGAYGSGDLVLLCESLTDFVGALWRKLDEGEGEFEDGWAEDVRNAIMEGHEFESVWGSDSSDVKL
ncbi:hypothetical protein HDV00_008612 [Rhizophlyctis rosea]|nr:hypothetical protein HDV00_008612 [Rhizophlyctis rosea]